MDGGVLLLGFVLVDDLQPLLVVRLELSLPDLHGARAQAAGCVGCVRGA